MQRALPRHMAESFDLHISKTSQLTADTGTPATRRVRTLHAILRRLDDATGVCVHLQLASSEKRQLDHARPMQCAHAHRVHAPGLDHVRCTQARVHVQRTAFQRADSPRIRVMPSPAYKRMSLPAMDTRRVDARVPRDSGEWRHGSGLCRPPSLTNWHCRWLFRRSRGYCKDMYARELLDCCGVIL